MQPANPVAFKEWTVVCAALATGQQSLILRKGGIHEGRHGFRVEHPEFWLFPTAFHQELTALAEEARPLLEQVTREQPPEGTIRISHYAVVDSVFEIFESGILQQLASHHIWSNATVEQRFNYRQPGLFALIVRIYRAPLVTELADNPYFAGCRSWVELPEPLPTNGLEPVLGESAFQLEAGTLRALMTDSRD